MQRLPVVGGLVCVLLVLFLGCPKTRTTDTLVPVDADVPEMTAAIATARAKLPEFWRAFEQRAHGESEFSLKVEISDANGTEHFWLTDIEKKNGKIYGTINNEPQIVGCVTLGQRIEVLPDRISDWLYLRDGKMIGNYTLRPLLKRMPEEKAAALRAVLADP